MRVFFSKWNNKLSMNQPVIMESKSFFFLHGGNVFMVKVQKCENYLKQNLGGVF